jgi:hypothetical protein
MDTPDAKTADVKSNDDIKTYERIGDLLFEVSSDGTKVVVGFYKGKRLVTYIQNLHITG